MRVLVRYGCKEHKDKKYQQMFDVRLRNNFFGQHVTACTKTARSQIVEIAAILAKFTSSCD